MYTQFSKNDQYRAEGSKLFKKQTDEFGRDSYVFVYRNDSASGINQLIHLYENSFSEEFE